MTRITKTAACMAVWILGLTSANGATPYVKPTPSGSADCSSWANACGLSTAIAQAADGDQVWATAGVYGPISLAGGVKVYGGFNGAETSASQSNPDTNISIIDGAGAQAVSSIGNDSATALRGFTIKNGFDGSYDGGGGANIVDSNAIFVRCMFQDNRAAWWGGAASIRGTGSPKFVNCKFHGNGEGPGATNYGGGAVWLDGPTPTFTNCLFYNNKASEGGVIVVRSGAPTFIHCTMSGNQATQGAGGAVADFEGAATIRNSILWGNTAAQGGNEIISGAGYVSTVTYSTVGGGYSGTGNLSTDPLFAAPSSNNYSLSSSSPCINAGNNAALPSDVGDLDWDANTSELLPKALNLLARKFQQVVDMGAYEILGGGGGGGGAD